MTRRERFARWMLRRLGIDAVLPGDRIMFSVDLVDLWKAGPYETSIVVKMVGTRQDTEVADTKIILLTNA